MKVDNCTRTNVATVVECQNYILKKGGGTGRRRESNQGDCGVQCTKKCFRIVHLWKIIKQFGNFSKS